MKVICPRCGQSITANESWAGTMVNCPKCGKKVAVPEVKEPSKAKPLDRPPAKQKPAADEDDDFQLAPAEQRPKMHVTEDELQLSPEQPRPKTETLLESAAAPTAKKVTPVRPKPAPASANKDSATPAPPKAKRKTSAEPCPNCGAQLPPDGMLCLECGYHLVLKRVLETDMRDMGLNSATGFQRWINSQMSEGESITSMLWLLHAVVLVIAVAFGLVFHPHGWLFVVPLYALYFGLVFWARKSKMYLRWGDAVWNRMLRRNQRRGWKGRKAFISHDREFDDQSLGELEDLEELEVLDLQGTSVTDGALRHIQFCGALKFIVVRGTRFTPKGVERLQIMKPDVSIWA